jgi:integrase
VGWTAAALDWLLEQPDNYYQLTLFSSRREDEARQTELLAQLADSLFPRLADWYSKAYAAADLASGPVFCAVDRHGNLGDRLSDHAVARLVKEHAALVGLDPARYAGHSLRAGLATSAADGGASDRAIMRQTGHRSSAMVNRYVREGRLFRDNAAMLAGL